MAADLTTVLSGGDRRSVGRVSEVVAAAMKDRALIAVLVQLLTHEEVLVRMRAGDALEKLQRAIPNDIEPVRARLFAVAEQTTEQELRWHMAQMLPRMKLTKAERSRIAKVFETYFADKSAIVRVSALQAIVDLARQDASLRRLAKRRLALARQGSAAEKARARKLASDAADWLE